jgi:hypothetical protein
VAKILQASLTKMIVPSKVAQASRFHAAAAASECDSFKARPNGEGVPFEYLPALQALRVTSLLMEECPLLDSLVLLSSLPRLSPEATAIALVRTAFNLDSDANASAFTKSFPEYDLFQPQRVCSEVTCFINQFKWECASVCSALYTLMHSELPEALVLLIGVMAHAAPQCASRRRSALCTILSCLPVPDGSLSTQGSSFVPFLFSSTVAVAAARLRSVAAQVVHETKDKAFDQTFMQPCMMYAASAGGWHPTQR